MKTNFQSCSSSGACSIDVIGLCEPSNTTETLREYPYWKQMYISESLVVPSRKPDIEKIDSVDVSVSIFRAEVVKTPRSYNDNGATPVPLESLEGKLLTGRKLIIEGQLCQKIVYTANELEQPVHSVHFYVPFSSYIVVPKDIVVDTVNGVDITEDSFNLDFDVNACIEDIAICAMDERNILKQVTLLLSAVPQS